MTTRRGRREKIAPGIYRDALGHEVRALAAGKVKSKRFPKAATMASMKKWQDDARRDLRKNARARKSDLRPGTLAGDVEAHLATLPEAELAETSYLYAAWLTPELKAKPRHAITLAELRTCVATWSDAKVAASTISHRIRALRKLYEALDGDEPTVLPRRLKRPGAPALKPRAFDMVVLTAMLDGMKDFPSTTRPWQRSKAKARLMFLLWGGMAPATLKRMTAHAVDLEAQTMTLPAREKGRGAPAVTLPLVVPEGVRAAKMWLQAHAWGRFDRRRLYARFRGAVKRYAALHPEVSIPPGLRMQDLRHSFLTWLARQTVTPETPAGNPYVVQAYGQHKNLATTQRYMLAIIPEMVRQTLRSPRSSVARGRGTTTAQS